MISQAYVNFNHAIQDSVDLMQHFDALNKQPSPTEIEVLKRASLVMGLAALETYFEDRVLEAVNDLCERNNTENKLAPLYKKLLEIELKSFHSPTVERTKSIFIKYLDLDVTQGWEWNNCNQEQAKTELNRLVKKRGDIAHRSLRPMPSQPIAHAVTRDELRKHIHFIKELVKATDVYIESKL